MMFQWVKDWRPSTTIDPKDPQKRLHQDCKGEYCEAGEELQDQNTSAGKIGHGGMVCCPGHIEIRKTNGFPRRRMQMRFEKVQVNAFTYGQSPRRAYLLVAAHMLTKNPNACMTYKKTSTCVSLHL